MKRFSVLAILFLIISCKKSENSSQPISSSGPSKPALAQVEAIVADFQLVNQDLQLPGKLVAAEQIELHPEISAKVKDIYFKDAQIVSKNQLLVKLNDEELVARLKKLKTQEQLLKSNEQRQLELFKSKAIGQSEYEAILLQYKNVLSDIHIAETELRKFNIKAPFAGSLGFRNVSPGDFVTSSTVISTLTQIHPLKLRFSVPEQYSNRLIPNQKIQFSGENTNSEYSAMITSFSPFLNEESKSLDVLALVSNRDKSLRPGSYASIILKLDERPNRIFIPSQCIIPRIKDKQVALSKNGKVQFATVTVGFRDSARVEITNGINKGDTVISSGLMRLKPGMPIMITNLKPE
ncbi:MAG: efflux RND transporter periplasmic adaptor subunit [Saprospiraceae bacterium]|nr:efflux RND transporter periplasmic adaptor subunit [Saprospiraceae bacterium]